MDVFFCCKTRRTKNENDEGETQVENLIKNGDDEKREESDDGTESELSGIKVEEEEADMLREKIANAEAIVASELERIQAAKRNERHEEESEAKDCIDEDLPRKRSLREARKMRMKSDSEKAASSGTESADSDEALPERLGEVGGVGRGDSGPANLSSGEDATSASAGDRVDRVSFLRRVPPPLPLPPRREAPGVEASRTTTAKFVGGVDGVVGAGGTGLGKAVRTFPPGNIREAGGGEGFVEGVDGEVEGDQNFGAESGLTVDDDDDDDIQSKHHRNEDTRSPSSVFGGAPTKIGASDESFDSPAKKTDVDAGLEMEFAIGADSTDSMTSVWTTTMSPWSPTTAWSPTASEDFVEVVVSQKESGVEAGGQGIVYSNLLPPTTTPPLLNNAGTRSRSSSGNDEESFESDDTLESDAQEADAKGPDINNQSDDCPEIVFPCLKEMKESVKSPATLIRAPMGVGFADRVLERIVDDGLVAVASWDDQP